MGPKDAAPLIPHSHALAPHLGTWKQTSAESESTPPLSHVPSLPSSPTRAHTHTHTHTPDNPSCCSGRRVRGRLWEGATLISMLCPSSSTAGPSADCSTPATQTVSRLVDGIAAAGVSQTRVVRSCRLSTAVAPPRVTVATLRCTAVLLHCSHIDVRCTVPPGVLLVLCCACWASTAGTH